MSTVKPGSTFGAEIRRLRESLGLTLEDLGALSNLTPNYIGGIERGQRDPSLSTVLALARGLGVPAGQLLGFSGDVSSAAMEAARAFDELPNTMKEAVLVLLRTVAARERKKATG